VTPLAIHGIRPSTCPYVYLVPSETTDKTYHVRTDVHPWTCDCMGFTAHKHCKHIEWMIEYLKAYVNECEAKYELLDEEEYPVAAKKVGVLWLKTSKDGKTKYWSGVVNLGLLGDIQISILRNTFKKEENQPDYNILLVEPKPDTAPAPANGKADYDDDIPF
jgi:hypothetical protein